MKKLFRNFKNPLVLRILITFGICILILGALFFFEKRRDRVFIDDSLVTAPIINIAPLNSGTLLANDVYEGEKIKQGDPIAVVGGETLYADNDGLIIMANNQIGSLANSQTPVAQMINLIDLRIAGTIDENKGLDQIRVGQVASFTVDALPGKTFWGYVDEISPSAKQTTLAFSISSERPTQQFVIYVKFNSAAYPEIKNGMSAKLTVYTKTQ